MRVDHLRRLNGPNVYLPRPVAIARVELEELTGRETTDHPGFADTLVRVLPGLAAHHCSAGVPGGLLAAMAEGTYFGHVTEHVTLELSGLIGREVFFGRTVLAGEAGSYDVILECPLDEPAESPVCRALIDLARDLVTEVLAGRVPDPAAALAEIAAVHERGRLGVSTAALARAARERGIPVRRVGRDNLLQLGYGRHRRTLWAAMSDGTSGIGIDTAGDKLLTKRLLAEAGIPVPEGWTVTAPEEAVAAHRDIGGPVVVKPLCGHQGQGIGIDLTDPADVLAAFAQAATISPDVLVEAYLPGIDYRVLVVGGRVAAAAEVRSAQVVGDGGSDIAALVELTNRDPDRGEGHDRPLTRITLGPAELENLARQGYAPDTVPASGEVVKLRRNANLSTGGTSRDVTALVHPDVAGMCVRVASTVGLDICGIDLRLPDIAAPLPGRDSSGVIEVNASPGLRMHLDPQEGTPRDVAAEIVDHLYPPGEPSRVPVVAVTGTNGKTTTVRMIGHILGRTGQRVGLACTTGVEIGDRLVYEADASGPRSAEMVLGDRSVDAAVLETARGGIVRRGLGYELADVAVITNITDDHLGADGIGCLDDLIEVKALVAEEIGRGGQLVLNADDPATAELSSRRSVRDRRPVIRFFSTDPANPVITTHLAQGGIAYLVEGATLVEAEATERRPILPSAEVAGSFDGRADHVLANALAASAAARALGTPLDAVAAGLRSFDPHTRNPGRGCVTVVEDRPVIVDYAHNAAAVDAIGRLVRRRWPDPGVAVVTLPGDRRDDLVTGTARALAGHFDRVVVYEDEDLRGRTPGEMTRLITEGLTEARPGLHWAAAGDLKQALTTALALTAPGEPVLLLYEKLQPVTDLLTTLGGLTPANS